MALVRESFDLVVIGHEPYPAVIRDRRGDLFTGNGAALGLFTAGVAPHLLEPPVNVYLLGLHPGGLAPRVRNMGPYSLHLPTRLQSEVSLTGDPALVALLEEVRGYPDLTHPEAVEHDPARLAFLPMDMTTEE